MSQIATLSLTSLGCYYWSPTTALVLNGDGTRGYVVVQDFGVEQHVSVIDTKPASPTRNTEIAVITEWTRRAQPDGSRRYVTQSDGKTVVVYDTATNTAIGSFTIDQNSGASPRSIAVAPTAPSTSPTPVTTRCTPSRSATRRCCSARFSSRQPIGL
jgi:DNA-binding beta-propeller fold protein YncE